MIGVKDAGKRVKRVIVVMEGFEVMVVQCKSHLQQYEYRRCKKEQSASCRASLHIVTLQSRPAALRDTARKVPQSFRVYTKSVQNSNKIEYSIQFGNVSGVGECL